MTQVERRALLALIEFVLAQAYLPKDPQLLAQLFAHASKLQAAAAALRERIAEE